MDGESCSPFLVSELRELHRILESVDEDIWCRYFAGSVLLAVYSRSRWSDLQHGQRLILDYDTVDDVKTLAFLEIHVFNHKTRKSTAFRNAFPPDLDVLSSLLTLVNVHKMTVF